MTLLSDWGIALTMNEMRGEVNRAFSAETILGFQDPGAMPQAGNETAPLALNKPVGTPKHLSSHRNREGGE
jgi:hypothetical protein